MNEPLPDPTAEGGDEPTLQPSTLERWLEDLEVDDSWQHPAQGSWLRTNTLAVTRALLEAAAAQGSQRGAEHLAAAEATGSKELVAAVRAAFPGLPIAERSRRPSTGRSPPPPPAAVLASGMSWARLGGIAVALPGNLRTMGSSLLRPAATVTARFSLSASRGRPIVRSKALLWPAPTALARSWRVV